ncbi:hypothetical protein COU96_01830 [Candidatus Shapirobacteria bacterium CG10_big_fil_rev_8_21_14_0_10_38_14]|uniref:DUF458 domain-containing protein n=1 Tax=Candidatus Shapirobacteria bacterium CG10_big_fil_rev_8_21_14_0_10_38_14 TaxID=1974483 RepID=A0A2M8L5D4_9BACT|nr:MAG: hypothetical protein COU96_01830 [Candidatus Shapirobacteria bacterium CG10_big_fil_rev_8_21_14_0_10_38_14]
MNNFLQGYFYNPTLGNLKINQVIDEIFSYINERPEKFYDIIVGCDSSSGEEPHFPVAVVVLRVGEGGRFFLKKIGYKNRKFYNWKTRVLEEVLLSCELALFLREKVEKKLEHPQGGYPPFNYQFRYIHADIGENGATRDMIKEVTGLIRGNGFEPKIKPEAYVASTVADRYS